MSRPLIPARKAAAAATAVLLSTVGLAACGEEATPLDESGGGVDSVQISGEVGKAPEVAWDGKVNPDDLETEVVEEGDGEEIAEGDSVLTYLWVGNGFTERETYSSYSNEAPELIEVSGDLAPIFTAGLEGQKVGSRVAVAASSQDAFGTEGNPNLGIGNKDGVVIVFDLIQKVATEPSGEERTPAKWAPTLQEGEDGAITGFDFTNAHKPGGKLLETTLIKGDGAVVKKGQKIYVNYLGQVYDAKEPFDESYSGGQPASFPIGEGAVIKGWDDTLVGKTVGSRVILEIPPALGYGEQGNEGAGIKGTDTLFFVVDILAAA